MAEKGFGVKEVNLIGASGTPTITSPNNLNLNANNVAISTNVSIGGTLSVTGNVSVGGTLTYEDVTNIDSVGIVTARTGVVTPNLDVDDFISVGSNIHLGNAGVVTATTFSGSAASLTSVPAANITGTLPAISGANLTGITITPTATDVQVAYELLNTSASGAGWRITGNGIVNTVNNPDLYLIRGQKYRFINNSGGSHPFRIQSTSSAAYDTGVTNNNASSGNIDFVPRNDAPSRLYYNCTNHGGMLGNIYLRGAGGQETNVGVTTFSSSATLHTNRILPVGGAPSGGGGGVIQVAVGRLNSEISDSTSTSYMASGLIVSMTPKFSSSKFHIHMGGGRLKARSGSGIIVKMYVSINGGSYAAAYSGNRGDSFYYHSSGELQIPVSFVDLYTPSSAPTTIAFQPYWKVFGSPGGGGNTFLESDSNSYGEVVMTVMEVSA